MTKKQLEMYLTQGVVDMGGVSFMTVIGYQVVLLYGKVYFVSCTSDLEAIAGKLIKRGYSAGVLLDKDAVDVFLSAIRKRHAGDRDFEE